MNDQSNNFIFKLDSKQLFSIHFSVNKVKFIFIDTIFQCFFFYLFIIKSFEQIKTFKDIYTG